MALPANFWDEFTRRLDERLDQKLDQRLAPILERLDRIELRLDNLERRIVNVENWTKRQDRMLERETTTTIYKYLEQQLRQHRSSSGTARDPAGVSPERHL